MSVDHSMKKFSRFNSPKLNVKRDKTPNNDTEQIQTLPGELVSLYVMNGIKSNLRSNISQNITIESDTQIDKNRIPGLGRRLQLNKVTSSNSSVKKNIDIVSDKIDC